MEKPGRDHAESGGSHNPHKKGAAQHRRKYTRWSSVCKPFWMIAVFSQEIAVLATMRRANPAVYRISENVQFWQAAQAG